MIHPQHRHIRAPAGAALRHLAKRDVIHPQEADGTRRHSRARLDYVALRPQIGEGEAVAAAGLLDQGRIAEGLENAGRVPAHVVGYGNYETRGKLPEWGAGARKGGRVGEKAQAAQEGVKAVLRASHLVAVLVIRCGDRPGHPAEHAFHVLNRLPVDAPAQIPLLEHLAAVFGKLNLGRRLNGRLECFGSSESLDGILDHLDVSSQSHST